MRRVTALRAALGWSCLALVCGGASAQLKPEKQTGSMFNAKPKPVDPVRAADIQHRTASCVYSRQREMVERLIRASDFYTIDWQRLGKDQPTVIRKMGISECLGREAHGDESAIGLQIANSSMRPLLEEAAYLARYRSAPAPDASPVAARSFFSSAEQTAMLTMLAEVSDCVTRGNSAGADALLRTPAESGEELAAAKALAPDFGGCLTGGETFRLTPAMMRRLAADGMWQRYLASPVATGGRR